MTPFRQRYPYANGGYQIPNALVNVASESPHTKILTLKTLTLDYVLLVEYIHSCSVNNLPEKVVRKFIIIGGKNIFLKNLPSWILTLKYDSQLLKGYQVSNAIWNGAHQFVGIKKSKHKKTPGLGLVSNSMCSTSNMHCILKNYLPIINLGKWLKH